jgi:hypothetical protein
MWDRWQEASNACSEMNPGERTRGSLRLCACGPSALHARVSQARCHIFTFLDDGMISESERCGPLRRAGHPVCCLTHGFIHPQNLIRIVSSGFERALLYVALRKITFRFDSSASQDCAWVGAVGYVGYNVNDFGLAPVAFARALVGLPSGHSVGGTTDRSSQGTTLFSLSSDFVRTAVTFTTSQI